MPQGFPSENEERGAIARNNFLNKYEGFTPHEFPFKIEGVLDTRYSLQFFSTAQIRSDVSQNEQQIGFARHRFLCNSEGRLVLLLLIIFVLLVLLLLLGAATR